MGNCIGNYSTVGDVRTKDDDTQDTHMKEVLFHHMNIITQTFVNDFCDIGPNQICDNPLMLVAAYNHFLETQLRQIDDTINSHYFKHFYDSTVILMYLLNSLVDSDVKLIHIINSSCSFAPIVNVKPKEAKLFYGYHISTVKGVVGVRLRSFPV